MGSSVAQGDTSNSALINNPDVIDYFNLAAYPVTFFLSRVFDTKKRHLGQYCQYLHLSEFGSLDVYLLDYVFCYICLVLIERNC